MKKLLMSLLFLASPLFAVTHVGQGDNVTLSSVTATGANGIYSNYGISGGSLTARNLSNTIIAANASGVLISTTVTGGGASTYIREDWIPIGSCQSDGGTGYLGTGWNVVDSSAPTTAIGCGSGTPAGGIDKAFGVFSASEDKYYAYYWRLPSNFSALVSVSYVWSTDGTSKTQAFTYGAFCPGVTFNWLTASASFVTDAAFTDTSTSNAFTERVLTHPTTNVNGCTAGNLVYLLIGRNGTNGSDTGSSTYFGGINIRYTVTLP